MVRLLPVARGADGALAGAIWPLVGRPGVLPVAVDPFEAVALAEPDRAATAAVNAYDAAVGAFAAHALPGRHALDSSSIGITLTHMASIFLPWT
jgi:hypothetical protein